MDNHRVTPNKGVNITSTRIKVQITGKLKGKTLHGQVYKTVKKASRRMEKVQLYIKVHTRPMIDEKTVKIT